MQVDDAHHINLVLPMYNLIEYSEIIQKIWNLMAIL